MKVSINGHGMVALIDTGFNGAIATGLNIAVDRLGLDLQNEVFVTQLGDQSTRDFRWASSSILWFGTDRKVHTQVFMSDRRSRFDVVIGTQLLAGYILVVDFNEGAVSIKDPALREALP